MVAWTIEVSDEFATWYWTLDIDERGSVAKSVDKLAIHGPTLGRPDVDTLDGTRYHNLKELRVQHRGRPLRILFAFDPRRCAYLILGGDKTGNDDWYVSAIRRAEAIYAQHLIEIGG